MDTITVNGIPLAEFLGKEKGKEIQHFVSSTVGEIAKTLLPVRLRYKDSKKRRSRVRYLTPQQIRKEYGHMAFQTKAEKLIQVLKQHGPLTPMEAAAHIGEATPQTSRDCSTVMGRMAKTVPHLIERDTSKQPYIYSLTDEGIDTSVEGIYVQFLKKPMKDASAAIARARKLAKIRTKKPEESLGSTPAMAEHVRKMVDWERVAPEKPTTPEKAPEVVVRIKGEIRVVFALG